MNGVEKLLWEKVGEFLAQPTFEVGMETHIVAHVGEERLTRLKKLDDDHGLCHAIVGRMLGPAQGIDDQRVDSLEFREVAFVNLGK